MNNDAKAIEKVLIGRAITDLLSVMLLVTLALYLVFRRPRSWRGWMESHG